MEIIQVIGLGILVTVLIIVIKDQKPQIAFALTLLTSIIIFIFLLTKISPVIRIMERLAVQANVNIAFLETIMKIIGISYIAEFGAQITKDAGQGTIAAKIELVGKVLILVLAVPIISLIIETILNIFPEIN